MPALLYVTGIDIKVSVVPYYDQSAGYGADPALSVQPTGDIVYVNHTPCHKSEGGDAGPTNTTKWTSDLWIYLRSIL